MSKGPKKAAKLAARKKAAKSALTAQRQQESAQIGAEMRAYLGLKEGSKASRGLLRKVQEKLTKKRKGGKRLTAKEQKVLDNTYVLLTAEKIEGQDQPDGWEFGEAREAATEYIQRSGFRDRSEAELKASRKEDRINRAERSAQRAAGNARATTLDAVYKKEKK